MTELAAPQISSLMEALPGIAAVLRRPVANAIVALSRAAAGLAEFDGVHAEELLRFGVRRNLLTQDEVDVVSQAETSVVVTVPGLGDEVQAINSSAVKLARDAREMSGSDVFIAGSIGPLGELDQVVHVVSSLSFNPSAFQMFAQIFAHEWKQGVFHK